MTAQRNHYEVLGVPPTANTDQIKTKYRELARKFHPDVVKDKALGQKVFTQINQAYRILADPERRSQYDAALRSSGAVAAPVATAAQANGAAHQNGTRPAAAGGPAAATGAGLAPPQAAAVARLISDADFALLNGDPSTALGHCEGALRLDPQNAKALGLQGDALAAQARPEEAAAAYRRSLQYQASPMIQAKLSRLEGPGARTVPPSGSANGNTPAAGTPRPPAARPATPPPAQTGGLFGRLLGKKK